MNKHQVLISQDKKTFHASDLALLWEITNQNTLNITLKRFVDKGILKRIHKGFYATTDIKNINPFDLGFACLNTYGYLSSETILLKHGIIFQEIKYITFISSKSTTFKLNNNVYKSRQLKARYLHNSLGISKVNHHFEANLERAIADMLYYNPQYHFDNQQTINFKKVKKIQQEVGYVN